ncbi:transposase [Sinirhodobacter populi]|uniref:Transposase n=1 Tax=Paenirhodobacter populi TaxID=2306993 RepID=A0A443ILY4_9RHOB|nr:transposase [Sinirhodobacter populi]RWR27322.1 transposase [Sinirhodobacter populi]RWR27528.1 transposase [Sinirhodobacter populi]
MQRLPPRPKVRGRARSDDCKVLSGIIYVKRYGPRWHDEPAVYGPYKTLYDRFSCWSRMGIFARIFHELVPPGSQGGTLMIDSTFMKAHRAAASGPPRMPGPPSVHSASGSMPTTRAAM